MNCAYGVRRRTLPSVALGCGKPSPASVFQLFPYYVVSWLCSCVIAQSLLDVNELLANTFLSLIWKDIARQSILSAAHSFSNSQDAVQCRTDGPDFDPAAIRLITCQPNRGHKANETLSLFKPRPSSPDRLGGGAVDGVCFANGHCLGCAGGCD